MKLIRTLFVQKLYIERYNWSHYWRGKREDC